MPNPLENDDLGTERARDLDKQEPRRPAKLTLTIGNMVVDLSDWRAPDYDSELAAARASIKSLAAKKESP